MLLIGSRALVYHFPDFRKPADWDLVGTRTDAARLEAALPRHAPERDKHHKVHFRYDDALVELALVEESPYWEKISKAFADGPTMTDPVLGQMTIPPASFLMLTKQCGLIYRIAHWHKNLEDLYYLRNLITEIPPHVATLLPDAQQNSREMFAARHDAVASEAWACHPKLPRHPRPDFHRELHQRLALGKSPMVDVPDAWRAFPQLPYEERTAAMSRLFAEEAMVLAAHLYLESPSGDRARTPGELKRFALRALIVSGLPEGWRYFGVNHYREIADAIPEDWHGAIADLEGMRPTATQPCVDPTASEVTPLWGEPGAT